ncbi:MAG: hypothetical protein IJ746_02100 [Ruminococcus sp.]|nr:hypothetical protein [Ruminococcus sp.]
MRLLRCLAAAAVCAGMLSACSSRPENTTRPASTAARADNVYVVNGRDEVELRDSYVLAETAGAEIRLSAFGASTFAVLVKNNSDTTLNVRSCYLEADGVVYESSYLSSGMLAPGEEATTSCSFPEGVSPTTVRVRFYCIDYETYTYLPGSLTDVVEVQRGGSDRLERRFPAESLYSDDKLDVKLAEYRKGEEYSHLILCITNKQDREIYLTEESSVLEPEGLDGYLRCAIPAGATAYADLELGVGYFEQGEPPYVLLAINGYEPEAGLSSDYSEPLFTTEKIFIPLTTDERPDPTEPEEPTEPSEPQEPAEPEGDPQPTRTLEELKEYAEGYGMKELAPLSVTYDGGEPRAEAEDGAVTVEYAFCALSEAEDEDERDSLQVYFLATNKTDFSLTATGQATVNGLRLYSTSLPSISAHSAEYVCFYAPIGSFREYCGELADLSVQLRFEDLSGGMADESGVLTLKPFELKFAEREQTFDPAESGAPVIFDDERVTVYELGKQDMGYTIGISLCAVNKSGETLLMMCDEADAEGSMWLMGAACDIPAEGACYSEVYAVDLNGGTDLTVEATEGMGIRITLYDTDLEVLGEGEAEL